MVAFGNLLLNTDFLSKLKVLALEVQGSIVEAVCQEREVTGRTLQDRIEGLGAFGLISHVEAEILHSIRHLGNSAAHEVRAHTTSELATALVVVEHLLNAVYVLPEKAKHLPQEKTKKKKKKPAAQVGKARAK